MDMFEEPLVDFTATTWSIAGDNDYEKRELPGEMGRSAFLVSVRVICTNHTRGSYCNETGGKAFSQVLVFNRPRPAFKNWDRFVWNTTS